MSGTVIFNIRTTIWRDRLYNGTLSGQFCVCTFSYSTFI